MAHNGRTLSLTVVVFGCLGLATACGGGLEQKTANTNERPWEGQSNVVQQALSGPPSCGTEIGSFQGTAAYSNGSYTGTTTGCRGWGTYGLQYQCVELVNRYFVSKGLGAIITGQAGAGMCNAAAAMPDYVVYWQGSTHAPVPGDALEWSDSNGGGHTALVTDNSGGYISFLQQNVGTASTYYPTDRVPWSGSGFGWYSGLQPTCWIHAKANAGVPAAAACYSSTLAQTVSSGTCVQSSSDGSWYHCTNGSWYSGAASCTSSYPWCYSRTMGANEPPRSCVRSSYDGVWYQCSVGGVWSAPVVNGSGPLGACSQNLP